MPLSPKGILKTRFYLNKKGKLNNFQQYCITFSSKETGSRCLILPNLVFTKMYTVQHAYIWQIYIFKRQVE